MFLLVLAYLGSPRQRAVTVVAVVVKQLFSCVMG